MVLVDLQKLKAFITKGKIVKIVNNNHSMSIDSCFNVVIFTESEDDDERTSISVILNNEESIIQLMERTDTVSCILSLSSTLC